MGLLKEWKTLYENQTDDTIQKFWSEYTTTEKMIYEKILDDYPNPYKGVVSELAASFNAKDTVFMGFIDGISESLKNGDDLELDSIEPNSEIDLEIDYEKLYFNMLDAKADYLYTLPQWNDILTPEKRAEITKAFRISKTVVKGDKIGRNDPCPCGSGKKYKKCCGKDA